MPLSTELPKYFATHLPGLRVHELALVDKAAKALGTAHRNQLYVAVPMFFRETSLSQYLSIVAKQAIENRAKIIVLFNGPAKRATFREYQDRLARARHDILIANRSHGLQWSYLFDLRFDIPASMGRIRAILCDCILLNASQSRVETPIIVCNDVDTTAISADYFSSYRQLFLEDGTPFSCGEVNYGYVGHVSIGLPGSVQVPELFIYNELNRAIHECTRSGRIDHERRLWSQGANLAFLGCAYCACGGFDIDVRYGEDDQIDRAFHQSGPNAESVALETASKIVGQPPLFNCSAWLATNPRRVLHTIALGRPGMEAWTATPFVHHAGAEIDVEQTAVACAQDDGSQISVTTLRRALVAAGTADRKMISQRLRWLVERSIMCELDVPVVDDAQRRAVEEEIELFASDSDDNDYDWNNSPFIDHLISLTKVRQHLRCDARSKPWMVRA